MLRSGHSIMPLPSASRSALTLCADADTTIPSCESVHLGAKEGVPSQIRFNSPAMEAR